MSAPHSLGVGVLLWAIVVEVLWQPQTAIVFIRCSSSRPSPPKERKRKLGDLSKSESISCMSGEHGFQDTTWISWCPIQPISRISLSLHTGACPLQQLPAEEGAVSKTHACLTFSLAMAQPHNGAPPMQCQGQGTPTYALRSFPSKTWLFSLHENVQNTLTHCIHKLYGLRPAKKFHQNDSQITIWLNYHQLSQYWNML